MIDLRVLGAIDVRAGAPNQPRSVVIQPKRLALLLYMALAEPGGMHARERLMALLWPEADDLSARHSLRNALHALRQAIGDEAIVTRGEAYVGLNFQALRCDALELRTHLAAGRVDEAIAVWTGDLAPGFYVSGAPDFERWLDALRDELRDALRAAAWKRTRELQGTGETEMDALRRALRLDPGNESGARRLMQLLGAAGDRGGALRVYQSLADHFARELESDLSAETQALASELRSVEVPPSAPTTVPAHAAVSSPPPRAATPDAASAVRSSGPSPSWVRSSSTPRIAVTLALAVGLGAYVTYRSVRADGHAPAQPLSFAAVPFTNLSRDSTSEYRAEGISDEILTAVGSYGGIQVVGRNAARRYRARDIDERVVERELGAGLLLTGTYEARGDSVVISAHLDDSLARGELWTGSFRSAPANVRSLPDSIARVLTETMRSRYGNRVGERRRRALPVAEPGGAGYNDYLRGRALLLLRSQRGSNLRESVKSFEAAIRLDPNYAPAYVGLAEALSFFPWFFGTPHAAVRDSVIRSAQRALALDPNLASAHSAVAMVLATSAQWDQASAEFQRALALEPDNFDVHYNYGRFSTMRGDVAEALRQFEQAKRLERPSPLVWAWASYAHYLSGDTASALRESELALRLDSTLAATTNLGTLVRLGTGRLDEARRLIELQLPPGPMSTAAYGYAKLGNTAAAMHIVDAMDSITPRPWYADVQRASVVLAMGDTARALSALERAALTAGPMWIALISPRDPAFDPVRPSARFARLVRQAGLSVPRVTASR